MTTGGTNRGDEHQRDLVTRTARSIALRVGATTAVVVLLGILAAGFLFDRQQAGDIRRQVMSAAAMADDVADAPPGIWIVELTSSGSRATPGTPAAVESAAAESLRAEVKARSGAGSGSASGGGTEAPAPSSPFSLPVVTAERDWPAAGVVHDAGSFATVYDMRIHRAQEGSMLVSMGVAGVAGVALSAAAGLLAGRRAVRPLADALELQRQFVADASHELRTPLSVISIRAQMLRRHLRSRGQDELLPEVDQLVDDTKVMSDVVSDLLVSAQLDASEGPREPVNLVHIAEQVGRSLEPYAAASEVTLTWPDSAPRAPVVVDGVSSSLRRAVLALVDNAIAHSPLGAAVEVTVQADDDWARVDVVDHGSGVDPADLDRLTRRFARARDDGNARRFGLGLALVTQIVRSHGGKLDVSETPGGGATFRLVLPLSGVDDAE